MKPVRLLPPLLLLLLLSLPPPDPPGQLKPLPESGLVVQVIQSSVALEGPEKDIPPPDGRVIEDCIVTYYDEGGLSNA